MTTWASLTTPITKQQRAGSNRLYQFDIGALIVPPWQPNMAISPSTIIRPNECNQTGFWYQPNGYGQTGDSEPGWGSVVSGITPDGSVDWTAIAPPGSGQDSIASVIYNQVNPPDSELTITPATNSQRVASAYFGGMTSGLAYTINIAITMVSGAIYVPQLILAAL